MQHFKHETYDRPKTDLIAAYISNTASYLRRRYPQVTLTEILEFVKKEVNTRLRRPKMELVNYPSYGNAELISVDLLEYTKQFQENIVTPVGVLYMRPTKKEAFLKKKISDNLKFRKTQKKIMLEATAVGDDIIAQRSNYLQSMIKIETNSIPGAFGSPFNNLFDIPGYNAITGVSRHSIMCGYAHVERMIAGNFYLPDIDHVINYFIILCRICPKNLMEVMHKYQLHIPTIGEVCAHFTTSMKHYNLMTSELAQQLENAVACLSVAERCFVYYAYCPTNLLMRNEHYFRPFLKNFFSTTPEVRLDADPKDIFKFHGDLTAMVTSLNADIIHRLPVSDAIAQHPEGVKRLIDIAHQMDRLLDSTGDIWTTFMRVDCDTADAMSHPNMIRKAVIISDTDSVLFTTQEWISWYTQQEISFGREAYEINAFIVFLVVMTLEQIFARLSTSFGAEGADIHKIAMKNEFMYPLMLRTPLPKQYAGKVAIQEGFVLPKIKDDIKGLSFRSSKFCRETAKAGENFRNFVFDGVMKNGKIKASDLIDLIRQHEHNIMKSVEAGDRTYLTTEPVKNAGDYKEAEQSIYYNWTFWDQVFAPVFGVFVIPDKGYALPIIDGGRVFRDPAYLDRVEKFDKQMRRRLDDFFIKNKRDITTVVFPMTLKQIPEILRPIIDIRSVVFANSTPFHVTMRSLGIGYTDSNNKSLMTDTYG